MTLELLEKIDKKMKRELKKKGAHLDAIYYCLHHPEKGFPDEVPELKINCSCRKPKPGLLLKAAKELNIDLRKSYMIGDRLIDIEAGKRVNCKTIFLGDFKSYYCEATRKQKIKPDFVAKNLLEVTKIIKSRKQENN